MYSGGYVAIRGRSVVADLSEIIVAPTVYLAVASDSAGVIASGSDFFGEEARHGALRYGGGDETISRS